MFIKDVASQLKGTPINKVRFQRSDVGKEKQLKIGF